MYLDELLILSTSVRKNQIDFLLRCEMTGISGDMRRERAYDVNDCHTERNRVKRSVSRYVGYLTGQ